MWQVLDQGLDSYIGTEGRVTCPGFLGVWWRGPDPRGNSVQAFYKENLELPLVQSLTEGLEVAFICLAPGSTKSGLQRIRAGKVACPCHWASTPSSSEVPSMTARSQHCCHQD